MTTVILLIGLIGIPASIFQPPHSLDSEESEMTVELIDAPMVDLPFPKPKIIGRPGGNGSLTPAATEVSKGQTDSAYALTPTNGPFGGSIHAFSVVGSGTLFAGTNSGEIYRSTDNGESWVHVNKGHGIWAAAFAQAGEIVYVVDSGGLHRSEDNGETWTRVNNGLGSDATRIRTLATIGETVYAGTSKHGVYRLDTARDVWIPVVEGLTYQNIASLAVMGKTLYAIGYPVYPERSITENAIFRLDEGTGIWKKLQVNTRWWFESWLGKRQGMVLALFVQDDTLYATTDRAILRSENQGESWKWFELPPGIWMGGRTSLVGSASRIYVFSYPSGLLQSLDRGRSWNPIGTRPQNVETLTISGNTLFAYSHADGILRSMDDGRAWQQINTGIDKLDITSVLKQDETLYAAANFGGVFHSKDAGQSWVPMNTGLKNRNLTTLAVLSGKLYAGCLADSNNPSAPPDVSPPHIAGVFRFDHTASKWRSIDAGLSRGAMSLVVVRGQLYAGVMSGQPYIDSGGSGVYRFDEKSERWQSIGLENHGIRWLVAGANKLYAVTERSGEIFHCDLDTTTWRRIEDKLPKHRIPHRLVFHNGALYAASYVGGVFRLSADDTWISVNHDLPKRKVSCLAASDTALYAAVPSHGIFRLRVGAETWEPIYVQETRHPHIETMLVDGDVMYVGGYRTRVYRVSLAPDAFFRGLSDR